MFTVLIKDKIEDYVVTEKFFQVDRVEYLAKDTPDSDEGVFLSWNDGSGTHFGLDGNREIFIMNKEGQTVARYF